MMQERECPRRDDAAAYAVDALDAADRAEFESHLRVCPSCRDEVDRFEDAVGMMGWTLPEAEPPPDLKGRVLARIARERAADERSPVERNRRGDAAARLPAWAAAAMVALAVLSAASGGYAYRLAGRVARLERELGDPGRRLVALRTVALAGTEAAPSAHGRVTVIQEGEEVRVVLDVSGLPPLQGGESYQLWLIQDGRRENGGTFVVDAAGRGGVTRRFAAAPRFSAVGITREPDAFGTAPRGQRVMAGQG